MSHSLDRAAPTERGAVDLVGLLEERVARLVERHRDARKTIQDMRGQLKDREQRIGELTDRIYTLGRVRDDARKRLEALIAQIDRMEGRAP